MDALKGTSDIDDQINKKIVKPIADANKLWLNLELAKKPLACVEFIIVHELVHLLERSHNEVFVAYMDKFMPQWRCHREELNRLPFRHVDWKY